MYLKFDAFFKNFLLILKVAKGYSDWSSLSYIVCTKPCCIANSDLNIRSVIYDIIDASDIFFSRCVFSFRKTSLFPLKILLFPFEQITFPLRKISFSFIKPMFPSEKMPIPLCEKCIVTDLLTYLAFLFLVMSHNGCDYCRVFRSTARFFR